MIDLLVRMKLTLRSNMEDTLIVNHQFIEAIEYIQQLENLVPPSNLPGGYQPISNGSGTPPGKE